MSKVLEIRTTSSVRCFRPYPSYKNSGVDWLGEIPASWSTKRVKHNTYVKGRIGWQNLRSDEFIDEGPYLVTGMHFKDGGVAWDACYHIAKERYDMAPEIQLTKDDVLITKDGTIGKVAHIDQLPGPASLNSHLLVMRPLKNIYIPRFMFYLLGSEVFQHYVQRSQSGTTFFGITQEAVVNFPSILPSTEEQKTIIAFLDRETTRIDKLIAKKERQIALLLEKRSALISHAVTKGLNPKAKMKGSGIEWLGTIPEHWSTRKLKFLIAGGLVNGLFKKMEFFGTGVKLVNVFDVYRDNFLIDNDSLDRVEAEATEVTKYSVQSGDIFFVRSSLKLEGVGRSVCAADVTEPTVFECHVVRVRPKQQKISPKFLINFLNSEYAIHRFIALANMVTMATIDQDKISSLEIPLPPTNEQNEIVSYLQIHVRSIDNLALKIKASIDKLREYRTALISATVTGKIDVREEAA